MIIMYVKHAPVSIIVTSGQTHELVRSHLDLDVFSALVRTKNIVLQKNLTVTNYRHARPVQTNNTAPVQNPGV